jgi:uncharacterized protein YaaR (DUF327 family)
LDILVNLIREFFKKITTKDYTKSNLKKIKIRKSINFHLQITNIDHCIKSLKKILIQSRRSKLL